MKYILTLVALGLTFSASAQLSVGPGGMTFLATTPIAVDGLTLTPSATLSLVSNSIQASNTPVAGSPSSISRRYVLSTPILFSGTAGVNYLPAELNGYPEASLQLAYASAANTALKVTSSSTLNTSTHYVSNTLTNQTVLVLTASALPDLTPILYARPSSVYGTTNISLVVDVTELLSAPTSGTVTVYVSKDSKAPLTFSPTATSVNNRPVQNRVWNFDNTNSSFYILTTTQGIDADGVLSFGLRGTLSPGATKGVLTLSAIIDDGSGGETKNTNNSDADKIQYFAK